MCDYPALAGGAPVCAVDCLWRGGCDLSNNREEQRKVIRYNHLVANLVVFHNVVSMMRIFQELVGEGYRITPEIMPLFRPTGRSI